MHCGNCDGTLTRREWRGTSYPYCPRCCAFWTKKKLKLVHAHRRSPPPGAVLSLVYEPNGTDHSNLILRVGTWTSRSDGYYYALDHAAGQKPKPARAVRALLTGWRTAIQGCADGEVAFLPHDFSDQHTGWLRCLRRGDTFEIVDGWSNIEGYTFYPSDFSDTAAQVSDFTPHEDFGDPVVLELRQLLADIQASLSYLDRL